MYRARRIGLTLLFCLILAAAARGATEEGFFIKGSKTMAFYFRDLEGTKEGFTPGRAREETLRLNITGTAEGTEIDADLAGGGTAGTVQLMVRRAGTELCLGDFTAGLNETEFSGLNKVLSGARLSGDYGGWGFTALYSSPAGQDKAVRRYGDGTQGPYRLDFAPVVIGSDRVTVDGRAQKRGEDYTVDYQSGTVTFLKKAIAPQSVINVNYDFRRTVYQHTTSGLRLAGKLRDGLKFGATYLNDSDEPPGKEAASGEAVKPVSHYLIGMDGAWAGERAAAAGEIACSNRNGAAGRAVKLEISTQLGAWRLELFGRRVGEKFQPIAEAAPKQAVSQYGGGLAWRPGPLLGGSGNYGYEKYSLNGIVYENSYENVKAELTPGHWPSFELGYCRKEESNDPVSGALIRRAIVRRSLESRWQTGWLVQALKASREEDRPGTPSAEAAEYERFNFGLATAGLDRVSFTSNFELERRRAAADGRPSKKTAALNLSLSPDRSYFAAAALQYLEDGARESGSTADLVYRAEPTGFFRTEGKYTVQSLREEFATSEAVSRQTGSFSCDLRPAGGLRLRYFFKPSFTLLARSGGKVANDEQRLFEIELQPGGAWLVGLADKTGHSFNIDRRDAPNYSRRNDVSDTAARLYTVKVAPSRALSGELNYLLAGAATAQLVSAEPDYYLPGTGLERKLEAIVKAAPSEKLALDARYVYQRLARGTGEAEANLVDSISQTASLKGVWNLSEAWSVSVSGGYTRTADRLAAVPVSYTLTPGWGLVFRQGDRFRVDLEQTYAKTFAGSAKEVSGFSLRARYSVSDQINVTLRALRETGSRPDYRLTDISGNVEINL